MKVVQVAALASAKERAWNKEVPTVRACRLHGVRLWLLTATEECEQLCEDLNAFSTWAIAWEMNFHLDKNAHGDK